MTSNASQGWLECHPKDERLVVRGSAAESGDATRKLSWPMPWLFIDFISSRNCR